jgi:hypothetical protein
MDFQGTQPLKPIPGVQSNHPGGTQPRLFVPDNIPNLAAASESLPNRWVEQVFEDERSTIGRLSGGITVEVNDHEWESWYSLCMPNEERKATFERQQQIMKMFSDNTKTYIQLSGTALALTVTFAHEILHIPTNQNIADPWMVAMWVCFLIAIIAGAFYQYLAVTYLATTIDWSHTTFWDWLEPGIAYGVMLVAFYGGTIIFTFYAICRLRRP